MIYVIEGLDGVGKTTLANTLSRELGAPILKIARPYSHDDYIDDLIVARTLGVSFPLHDVILDRAVFSGLAYASRLRPGETRERIYADWCAALGDNAVTLIHLMASEEVRMERDPVGTVRWMGIDLDGMILDCVRRDLGGKSPLRRYIGVNTSALSPLAVRESVLAGLRKGQTEDAATTRAPELEATQRRSADRHPAQRIATRVGERLPDLY